jgi:hypothetical protein
VPSEMKNAVRLDMLGDTVQKNFKVRTCAFHPEKRLSDG